MKMRKFALRCWSLCLSCLLLVSCLTVTAGAQKTNWQVSLMHPENFFGEADEIGYNEKKEVMEYLFTVRKDPREDLESFAETLTQTEGVTLEKNKKSFFGGDRTLVLAYEGEDCIRIFWDKSEKLLTVSYGTAVVSRKEDKEKTVYGYTAEKYPEAFVEGMLQMYETEYGLAQVQTDTLGNGDKTLEVGPEGRVQFQWHDDACLLEPRYLLKQMDTESDSDGKHYTFEYTGKYEDMDWVYLKSGGKYHVKLTVKSYSSSQTALILYSYPEFYLKDPGSRFEATAPKSSSESKPTVGKEVDCPDCSGGRCTKCGGDGELDGYMAGVIGIQRNIQDCPSCHGGSCAKCYGTGKIRK